MSQLDFTTALARLLSDTQLRAEFAADPQTIADRLVEHADEADALASIDPAELQKQATGLISKRAGHVASLLPQTWNLLSNARELFGKYAATHVWPEGHQRHLIDAVGFGEWLNDKGHPALVHSEWKRQRFRLHGYRFAVCLIGHRSIPLRNRGVMFLWRSGNTVHAHQLRCWPTATSH